MNVLKPGDKVYDGEKKEYEILEPIGIGGMGYVLKVKRIEDGQEFALKTLSLFMPSDSDGDYRALLNEGALAQSLNHENVIKYEYFHTGEEYPILPPYIIMELADELNLQDLINSKKESGIFFEQSELLKLFGMLISGMEAINSAPLIHRDIKPANLLIKNGVIKISDFGIAKIAGDPTRTKSFKGSGTFAFFPPEAFQNKPNTIQMDIYSMGVVFYQLATLTHPYDEKVRKISNEDDWKKAHMFDIPFPPQEINNSLSPKIYAIILKMLEKKPSNRYSAWNEIRNEFLTVGALADSVHSAAIEKMISKNLEKNAATRKAQLEAEQQQEAEKQKKDLIYYQFDSDIVKPVRDFISEFNRINTIPEDKIAISELRAMGQYPSSDKAYEIIGGGHKWTANLSIRIITDEDFSRYQVTDIFDEIRTKTQKPVIFDKEILAWGILKASDGRGFNIILSKSEDSDYGDWHLLENTHSGFARHNDGRPDPFPFTYLELRTEIYHINVTHIYHLSAQPLSIQKVIDFISDL